MIANKQASGKCNSLGFGVVLAGPAYGPVRVLHFCNKRANAFFVAKPPDFCTALFRFVLRLKVFVNKAVCRTLDVLPSWAV